MVENWACGQGYGCCQQHRGMRNVIYVDCDLIEKVELDLEIKGKGYAISSFGNTEAMGYLVGNGFVMQRRVWCESDFYPQLELFSKTEKGLEKLAENLGLPFPKE